MKLTLAPVVLREEDKFGGGVEADKVGEEDAEDDEEDEEEEDDERSDCCSR